MKYPEITKCSSSAELHHVVADSIATLGLPVTLPTWPGQWGQIANSLRWDSCNMAPEVASDYLLLANILMDGEAHHSTLTRINRDLQETLVEGASEYLQGWLVSVNKLLKEQPFAAQSFDDLTSVELSVIYGRSFKDSYSREDLFNAMRTAIRLELGIWLMTIEGKPYVTFGSILKKLVPEAGNHLQAAGKLDAQRI